MTSRSRSLSTALTIPSMKDVLSIRGRSHCRIPPSTSADGPPCALARIPIVLLRWSGSRGRLAVPSDPNLPFDRCWRVSQVPASALPLSWCHLAQNRRLRRRRVPTSRKIPVPFAAAPRSHSRPCSHKLDSSHKDLSWAAGESTSGRCRPALCPQCAQLAISSPTPRGSQCPNL
jgi:hypothetical protein